MRRVQRLLHGRRTRPVRRLRRIRGDRRCRHAGSRLLDPLRRRSRRRRRCGARRSPLLPNRQLPSTLDDPVLRVLRTHEHRVRVLQLHVQDQDAAERLRAHQPRLVDLLGLSGRVGHPLHGRRAQTQATESFTWSTAPYLPGSVEVYQKQQNSSCPHWTKCTTRARISITATFSGGGNRLQTTGWFDRVKPGLPTGCPGYIVG